MKFRLASSALVLVLGPLLSAQDMEVFWRTTCARLAAEPKAAQVEPVAEALPRIIQSPCEAKSRRRMASTAMMIDATIAEPKKSRNMYGSVPAPSRHADVAISEQGLHPQLRPCRINAASRASVRGWP